MEKQIAADVIKGMLQALEHTLEALDRASAAATQLIEAQKSGKPLSPKTLTYCEEQFATLTRQREHMRAVIAQWWTLLEEGHHTDFGESHVGVSPVQHRWFGERARATQH